MLFEHKGWVLVPKEKGKRVPSPEQVKMDLLNEGLIGISVLSYKGNQDADIFKSISTVEGSVPAYAVFIIGYSHNQFIC